MPFITQQDLEDAFSPGEVRRLFADDGRAEPGPRLGVALEVSSSEGAAELGRNPDWRTQEAIQALVDADAAVRYAFCKLAMAVGMDAKPAWWPPTGGEATHPDRLRKEARSALKSLVDGDTASPRGEAVTATNTVKYVRVVNARQPEFSWRRGQRPTGRY
jgi:hypothetical protein